MPTKQQRRTFLGSAVGAGFLAVAGCLAGDDENGDDENGDDENGTGNGDPTYEIWALDQGRDAINVYEPADADDEFDPVEDIDLNALEDVPDEGVVPHMIDFSSDYEYAAVACTAGARTLVFRTEDKELVGNIETGAGSHMAAFSPDDEYIHVDAIGDGEIVRVEVDLDDESFEVVDSIEVLEDDVVLDAGIESGSPICHQWDGHGRTIHTLGPSYHDAAVVIVDHDDFTVDLAYSRDELPTNCGTMPHPTEDKFYLTAGLPSNPDEDEEGVGDYYVYDTAEDEIITEEGVSTEGVDAHGFWFTPDHEELWVLNRETNDGVILDPETDEVIEEIDEYVPGDNEKPDIMWASPDGEYMFVTSRGPNPQSAAHVAEGDTPGFSVIDVESREVVEHVEPAPGDDGSDFHGIGVAVLGDVDGATSPPY